MIISDKLAAIFIHIPKTAGESISEAISLQDPEAKVDHISIDSEAKIGKHATAMEIIDVIGENAYAKYFKSAFIRNPWEQAVSFYNHLRKPLHLPELKDQLMHPYNACKTALTHNFSDWVYEIYEKKQFQDEMVRSKALINHFKNQSEWFCDENDELIVDHIGRYESLYADLSYIERMTAIRFDKMPHKNNSTHGYYRNYYDVKSKAIITTQFKKDIEMFDYQF